MGSIGVLSYFQSEQSSLGNSMNIAGKNRYLTSNLLLQTEKYLDGSSDTSQVKAAMYSLQSNIMTLKQGGLMSGVDLKPLSSSFLDLWNIVNERWNDYKTSIQKVLIQSQQGKTATSSLSSISTTALDQLSLKKGLESMASDLIASSDVLVTQLGLQTDKNSQNLILLQIIFGILIIGILVLILYLVARMLRPIFDLTQAITKMKKGNYAVSVRQKGSDELSVLTESFNSMIASVRDFIENHHALTWKLEAANEQLKNKDRLKDEFINIAAHELRAPIQPILGLAEILRNRRSGGVRDSNGKVNKEDIELLDIIIRNAKRLLLLGQNILDMARIEGKSLKLDKERFDLIEKIHNVTNNFRSELSKEKIQLVFTPSQKEPIFVNADKVRIFEVISNLLSNATKFTKEGGSIIINAQKQDSQAIVTVKDTGLGIQPEIMPRLFSKFATNSAHGTGLGLFISKCIIEAHAGKIWAENNVEDGKGATFSFSLPISEQKPL